MFPIVVIVAIICVTYLGGKLLTFREVVVRPRREDLLLHDAGIELCPVCKRPRPHF